LEWASWGGKAVLAKYGREYFTELRHRRTSYPNYSQSPVVPPNSRLITARANGRKGGISRAHRHSAKSLQAMARLGGIATGDRYGKDFYREIRKLRTHSSRGYITRRTQDRIREEAIQHAKTEKNWAIAELWKAVAKTWEQDGNQAVPASRLAEKPPSGR
jgi:hypothetical protein